MPIEKRNVFLPKHMPAAIDKYNSERRPRSIRSDEGETEAIDVPKTREIRYDRIARCNIFLYKPRRVVRQSRNSILPPPYDHVIKITNKTTIYFGISVPGG